MDQEGNTPRKGRRYIAFALTFNIIAITLGAFVKELTTANADLVNGIVYTCGLLVAAYMGAQIAPEIFNRGKQPNV